VGEVTGTDTTRNLVEVALTDGSLLTATIAGATSQGTPVEFAFTPVNALASRPIDDVVAPILSDLQRRLA